MIEVLAPAGSPLGLRAAVNAGADAVYLGGPSFGARAYAENFTCEEVCSGIRFAHIHRKKVYLTVNTLLKENEQSEQLYDYLLPYYLEGVDAVIVQDLGVLSFILDNFPGLPVHISTQMGVGSAYGARMLEKLGAARLITPRELSLEEIRSIRMQTGLEIEVFVHGALCYCYSGQCLLSSMIGGRSGNRGRCAQPCRLPYDVFEGGKRLNSKKESYVLSPRDLCALDLLPDCIEAGVTSFKIEGRMKKPEYAAGTVEKYRKYVDMYQEKGRTGYRVSEQDRRELSELFSRGDFTDGYFKRQNGREMLALDKPDHSCNEMLIKRLQKEYLETEKKEKVYGFVQLLKHKPACFQLQYSDSRVMVQGEAVEESRSHPLTEEDIKRQFSKMGNTPFAMETLKTETEKDVFLSVRSMNELRRQCVEKLEEELCGRCRREVPQPLRTGTLPPDAAAAKQGTAKQSPTGQSTAKRDIIEQSQAKQGTAKQSSEDTVYTALITRREQFSPVLRCGRISRIYIESEVAEPWELKLLAAQAKQAGKKLYYALPYVFRKQAISWFEAEGGKRLRALRENKDIGYLVRNLDSCAYFLEKAPKEMIFDYCCWRMNSSAEKQWLSLAGSLGKGIFLSPELNEGELLRSRRKRSQESLSMEKDSREKCGQEFLSMEKDSREERGQESLSMEKEFGLPGNEFIIYGRIPVMISAGCLLKTEAGCKKKETLLRLQDRKGMEFPVRNVCRYCYNMILNSVPIYIKEEEERLSRFRFGALCYRFTVETEKQTEDILSGKEPEAWTRGHFRRGVE